MKHKLWLSVAVAGLALMAFGKDEMPPPSADFKEGFRAGVRYGLLSHKMNPEEQSISAITTNAMFLYWAIVVKGGDLAPATNVSSINSPK